MTSRWRKSSYSGAGSNECVELDRRADLTKVRDSKAPHNHTLSFSSTTFDAFLKHIR